MCGSEARQCSAMACTAPFQRFGASSSIRRLSTGRPAVPAGFEDLLAQSANLSPQGINLVDGLVHHARIGLKADRYQFKNPHRLRPVWVQAITSVGQDRLDNRSQFVRYITPGEQLSQLMPRLTCGSHSRLLQRKYVAGGLEFASHSFVVLCAELCCAQGVKQTVCNLA